MCKHENTIITPESEEVCVFCGLVVDKCLECFNEENRQVNLKYEEGKIKEKLTDIFYNLHLPFGVFDKIILKYEDQLP